MTKTGLLEVEWVLRGGFLPQRVSEGLRKLVGLETLDVEDRPAVLRALAWHAAGMDFADALHLASSARAESFATFDETLVEAATRAGATPRVVIPPARA